VTTTPDQIADAGLEEPWRRLSIRMLAVHPVMELLRAIPYILIALVVSRSTPGGSGLWGLVAVGITIVIGLLRWATTAYRVTPTQVQVRRGLLGKSVLTVPRDRVRTVDLTSHFMHRLLGLTRVAVGTGQTDRRKDSGLVLDGMAATEGARLREELLRRSVVEAAPSAGVVQAPRETVVAALDPAWIRYGPFTLSGLVTIGVVAAFGWRIVNETHINPDQITVVHNAAGQLQRLPLATAVAEVVVAGLVIVALFSTVGYVLAYWNFKLTRTAHGTLHISRGLITTRSTTIEERRLRGVEYSEPLLLRAVGAARALAITTGLRVGRGAERGGTVLLPPAPSVHVRRVATDVLGDPVPVSVPLTRHPRAALRRRFTRALFGWLVLSGVALGLFWPLGHPQWTVFVALGLLPLFLLLAVDRYRSLGHAIVDGRVIFRQGSLVRRRYMVDGTGVVGWTMRQSFFQRRAGVLTLTATTAAGRQGYQLLDVTPATAVAIADEVQPGLLTPFLTPPLLTPPRS
jgi:putative membrane protein